MSGLTCGAPPNRHMGGVMSSFSFANGNCVEGGDLPDALVGVRDSKDPQGRLGRRNAS